MMRSILALAFLLQTFLGTAAFAENKNLFVLRKPVNPENLVQTFIPVGPDCRIGNIDFYWLMDGTRPKPPNDTLHCMTLKRLKTIVPEPSNKAGCPKELPPGAACYQKFITANEIAKTGQNIPLVIRSVKSASTGQCSVAAFMDLGTKVIQVKQVNTNGRVLEKRLTGATVQFTSVQVIGMDGAVAADLKCQHDCVEDINVEWGCQL